MAVLADLSCRPVSNIVIRTHFKQNCSCSCSCLCSLTRAHSHTCSFLCTQQSIAYNTKACNHTPPPPPPPPPFPLKETEKELECRMNQTCCRFQNMRTTFSTFELCHADVCANAMACVCTIPKGNETSR